MLLFGLTSILVHSPTFFPPFRVYVLDMVILAFESYGSCGKMAPQVNWIGKKVYLMKEWLRRLVVGTPQNPLNPETRRYIALIAFLAWIGLGSDGLSSANYGPEEAFRALGQYPFLAFYLAIAISITVFIISLAYNQVIELFPNGGGGYKVANKLIHPIAGLVSGSALIVDYVLTIAISLAAATDALYSLLPHNYQGHNLLVKVLLVIFLTALNIRGLKESIKILMPIFLGFIITHGFLIIYGIATDAREFPHLIHEVSRETHNVSATFGVMGLIALLLHAYSLGGGTYTGLEAVSNNINVLKEPRVLTGKWTMFYMAISLSFMAAGIMLLYMLVGVHPEAGKTYNAIVFGKLLSPFPYHGVLLFIVLAFEAGILLLGSNAGFLGGPAVVANMSVDGWCPSKFSNLSSRLIKQNGVILFGLGAILIMLMTNGDVHFLIILYSLNVFLTFTITLFGLVLHWFRKRKEEKFWLPKLTLSTLGFLICFFIFFVILISKFGDGGWLSILVTGAIAVTCYYIKRNYRLYHQKLDKLSERIEFPKGEIDYIPQLNPQKPTAAFFVTESRVLGVHTIQAARKLFPSRFWNYVFIEVGVVDVKSFGGMRSLELMQLQVSKNLKFFNAYANALGVPAKVYSGFSTNMVNELTEIAHKVCEEFSDVIFFSSRAIFSKDNLFNRFLHDDTASILQRKLNFAGEQLIITPMNID
jgi:amino acid transporter